MSDHMMTVKNGSLLVVDSEALNRDMLSRRLERAGYSVEVAGDEREALAAIQGKEIELVLLDSMMPGGARGVELLKLLRATYSPAQLPVIMVTATSESEQMTKALSSGANDCITKPVDFPVALARIQSQMERKRTEKALRDSEERYDLVACGANDGLWDWDLRTNKLRFSPRWKEMLGYRDDEIGESLKEWISRSHPEDQARLWSEFDDCLRPNGNTGLVFEHRMLHRDGSYRWMLTRGMVLRASDGLATRMAGSQTDITRVKSFDPLTGLANRVLFHERLERCVARLRKEAGYVFAVLFIDLDRFKVINDSLGHIVGDQLLVGAAKRLQLAIRSGGPRVRAVEEDLVARLGGDEFGILLDNLGCSSEACAVARRIKASLHKPFNLEGRDVFTTVSIGVAPADGSYRTATEVLRDADTAMYRAKALGRARYEVFDCEMRAKVIERLELENELHRAVDRNEFVVYYQPKVRLQTGKLTGFEALIRWQHPVRGLIPPNHFIPIAEETGMIVPIGLWVLREACATMRQWHREFPAEPPLSISVNISVRQFREPDLVDQVREILNETGLEPSCLQLELVESVFMEDVEAAIPVLNRLKALHVGLKIDDFGTGYSSLNCLRRLPFDSLKIDRAFVYNLCQNAGCAEVIKTVVALARKVGMEIIAEGIETKEQLECLRRLGCDHGQGFYFCEPLDAKAARALLGDARGPKGTQKISL